MAPPGGAKALVEKVASSCLMASSLMSRRLPSLSLGVKAACSTRLKLPRNAALTVPYERYVVSACSGFGLLHVCVTLHVWQPVTCITLPRGTRS